MFTTVYKYLVKYSLFHIKGTFGVTIVFYFSVHYQSITKYNFGRPATDGNLLYETYVIFNNYVVTTKKKKLSCQTQYKDHVN